MLFSEKSANPIEPKYFRRIHTPRILQMDDAESGAVALGIVAEYHGKFISNEELRVTCSVSTDNCELENILGAAIDYGFDAVKYQGDIRGLLEHELPSILSWKKNHFIVLEGVDKKGFYINDPAKGHVVISYEEFADHFTGNGLMLKPGQAFSPSGHPFSLVRLLRPFCKTFKWRIALIGVVSIAFALLGLALPAGVRFFLDQMLFPANFGPSAGLILVLFLAMTLSAILLYMYHHAVNLLRLGLSISLSSHLIWHMLRMPISYFVQRYSGELAYRVILCDNISEQLSRIISTIFLDTLIIIVFGITLFLYNIPLALCVSSSALISGLIILLANRLKSDAYASDELAKATAKTVELSGLKGIETLKSSASEYRYLSMWLGHFTKYLNQEQVIGKNNCVLNTLPSFSYAASQIVFISVGTIKLIEGQLTIGMFVAMQILMQHIFSSVFKLAELNTLFHFLKTDAERLHDIWDNPIDPELTLAPVEEVTILKGYVELQDVSFAYTGRSKPILTDVMLNLSPGKCSVLVGPSGSGRSTLAKVIAGIYPCTSGKLLFDNKPKNEISRMQFVRSIALVEQEAFLFPGTIRENLSFMNPDAPFDEIVAACKDACVHDDILNKRGGYEYVVTENGMNLSDGQRQRIELARNLLKNPSVLLLDEATSALDHVTELNIIKNVCRRGSAVFMITHHMNTIRSCDEIVVIYKGRIIAKGRYEELTPILGPQLDSFSKT